MQRQLLPFRRVAYEFRLRVRNVYHLPRNVTSRYVFGNDQCTRNAKIVETNSQLPWNCTMLLLFCALRCNGSCFFADELHTSSNFLPCTPQRNKEIRFEHDQCKRNVEVINQNLKCLQSVWLVLFCELRLCDCTVIAGDCNDCNDCSHCSYCNDCKEICFRSCPDISFVLWR